MGLLTNPLKFVWTKDLTSGSCEHPLPTWLVSLFPPEVRQSQFFLVGNTVSFLSGQPKLDLEGEGRDKGIFPMMDMAKCVSERLQ